MRTIAFLIFAAAAELALAAQTVDLNAPGALEAVRAESPWQHAKIVAILAGVQARPSSDVRTWMRTQFDASDVVATPLWHASDPPKMKLSFTLDRTRYTAMVVGRFPAAAPIPAR